VREGVRDPREHGDHLASARASNRVDRIDRNHADLDADAREPRTTFEASLAPHTSTDDARGTALAVPREFSRENAIAEVSCPHRAGVETDPQRTNGVRVPRSSIPSVLAGSPRPHPIIVFAIYSNSFGILSRDDRRLSPRAVPRCGSVADLSRLFRVEIDGENRIERVSRGTRERARLRGRQRT